MPDLDSMNITIKYKNFRTPDMPSSQATEITVGSDWVVISQLHCMGACSSLMIYSLTPGDAIKPALEYCIKEQVPIPCNISQRRYPFTSYAFLTASTSSDQEEAEAVLKELGFINTNRVRKEKNPQNLVRFWMIDMPTLVKNLGYNPSDYGLALIE